MTLRRFLLVLVAFAILPLRLLTPLNARAQVSCSACIATMNPAIRKSAAPA